MEQADRKQIWNSQILLYEMLEARESRYKKQKELIREGKGTLVCLMLNVPGPVKVTALTDWAFEQGKERITCRLKESGITIKEEETDYKKTGYELYMIVDADAVFVKKQLVSIEEENKLGRLFDIDVISVDQPHGHLYAAKKMSALWKDRTWMQQKQNTQHRGYDSSYQSNHKRRERGKKSCRFREYQKRNYLRRSNFASAMHCLRKLEQHQNRD